MFTYDELATIVGVLSDIHGGANKWDYAEVHILPGIDRPELKRALDKALQLRDEMEHRHGPG